VLLVLFSAHCSPAHRDLHAFPTRRSSDLWASRRISPPAPGAASCWLSPVTRTFAPAVSASCWIRVRWSEVTMLPSSTTTRSPARSEEHTSELQSRENLVCRLLLEKKKKHK